MTGLEYIQRQINLVKQQIKGSKIKFIITDTDPVTKVKKLQYDLYENELQTLESIEKSLKALEIIKKFIWVEDDKLKCGRFGDIEIELDESDFESKEEYETIKEVLE